MVKEENKAKGKGAEGVFYRKMGLSGSGFYK